MSAPKSLAGYPEWFFTIAERGMKSGYHEELETESPGAATNLRQRFYKFRQLLIEQRHPHASGALSLTLTIKGTTIIFSQLGGLSESAMRQLGESIAKPAASANAPDRLETSDRAEDLLNEMLGIKSVESSTGVAQTGVAKPESDVKCPPHEPDATGAMCLRCGILL